MFPVSSKKITNSQDGFTLVEVMVALVVFITVILVSYAMQVTSTVTNSKSNSVATASTWAQYIAEKLLPLQYTTYYTDPLLLNNHGNGNNVAHLQDATAATADGTGYVRSDGSILINPAVAPPNLLYTIYWDILDNRPMNNIKQIHIIVVHNSGPNFGQLYVQDYFKLGPI